MRAVNSGVVIMKKPVLFLLLAFSAGLSLATAAPSGRDPSNSGLTASAASREPEGAERDRDAPSPQAMCRQVEVQLDEGYGVSSRETRLVCEENP